MRVITSPGCPLSRQILVAALEHSIHVDVAGADDGEDLLNPLRRTPLAITSQGRGLQDFGAIFTYMETLCEGSLLLPPESRWTVLERVSLCTELTRLIIRR